MLAKHFGEAAILYDKYHEAEFARHDLGIYLPKLYGEQSDLIVPVLCPDYDAKALDRLGMGPHLRPADQDRRVPRNALPIRSAQKRMGSAPAAGFIELDEKTPEQVATLILERLALNEGKPKDHYTKAAVGDSKSLSTSIAEQSSAPPVLLRAPEELKQIADALDPENRTWGTLIDGPGGMGKTSLAVRAAYDCPPGQFQRIIFLPEGP